MPRRAARQRARCRLANGHHHQRRRPPALEDPLPRHPQAIREETCANSRGGRHNRPAPLPAPPHRAPPPAAAQSGSCRSRSVHQDGRGTTAGAARTTAASPPDAPPATAPDAPAPASPSRSASASTVGASNRLRIASSTPSAPGSGRSAGSPAANAAELEEIVVDADPLDPQHLGEQPAQQLLLRRPGTPQEPDPERRRAPASARRSSLPFGVSGSRSSITNRRRHHVVG